MKIEFIAQDVRPRAQKDGSWDILFEGMDTETLSASVALLCTLRNKALRVVVTMNDEDEDAE